MSSQKLRRKASQRPFGESDLSLLDAPAQLFHPYRMLIMNALKLHGNIEFRQLKHNLPRITDGNLASHLAVLEKSGYILCHKEVVKRKLRTSYEITKKGRKDFRQLSDSLKKMIEHIARLEEKLITIINYNHLRQ